ncbi:MAG: hypothetical protein M0026_15920 [Nocardiopsaceae bacterium]|mgnify:CR=1 FL=1|nr:hypothetical protein [Nocardiopsaceae bacterium]
MSDHSFSAADPSAQNSLPCTGCGARLHYAPGTHNLSCPYCGQQQKIAAPTRAVREHSYESLLTKQAKPAGEIAAYRFTCNGCGAHVQGDNELSSTCQFCASPLVADTAADHQIEPEAVLPFELDRKATSEALREWVKSRWFAPNRLKQVTTAESMKSTYLPHWTFDAKTASKYTGQRGEYYYVTETYTATVNGKREQRTRRVRKTRWYPARGKVTRSFDDVLVAATTRVTPDQLDKLEPWPLARARPYRPDYLAGHETLRYDVEPGSGLAEAKKEMAAAIEKDCRRDIGGDTQRVHSINTSYSDITGKLMLLPVWIGSYLYNGKPWQVLINGCTGEVQGDRPYSAVKIISAVVAALVVLALVVAVAQYTR